MFSIPKQIWIAFLPVFSIVLAIVLFVFQARLDLLFLSAKYVAINTILAILIALGITIILLAVCALLLRLLAIGFRRITLRITFHVLQGAIKKYSSAVQAIGIAEGEGSIIIRLAIGSSHSVDFGDRFEVSNATSRERWGMLEVIAVEEESCVCQVSDRINVEFWEELESRMRRDPSPPSGVAFFREVPEELLQFMERLIRN